MSTKSRTMQKNVENKMLLIKRVIYKTTCKYTRTIAPLCGESVIV